MTDLLDLTARVGPVLLFFVAITVVAEVADVAGVFDVAGHWTARAARHHTLRLWLLFVALATASTVVLSLDTTAVLLTPVGLAVAAQLGISPVPIALSTLWLANTASLLLPVSNLTNLLAQHHFSRMGTSHLGYIRLAAAPAVAAVLGTVVVLYLLHRRELSGRYQVDAPAEPHDVTLLRIAAAVCVVIAPLFAVGASPAVVATVAAVGLVAATAWRAPQLLRRLKVPWLMAVGVAVLFVVVDVALRNGLEPLLVGIAGTGTGAGDLVRVGAVGVAGANLVNNLPAYAVLESVADDPLRLMALLIGVNVGPLVTPWASLATLLWAQRCRARGVRISVWSLAGQGAVCGVVAVGASLGALVLLG